LVAEGGTFRIPVTINDTITLNFMVDSGASDVLIPADVILTLVRAGSLSRSEFIGMKSYQLADGSAVSQRTFNIRSLRVGGIPVDNVTGVFRRGTETPFGFQK
jgi:predicted aspartyl protease